MYKIGVFFVGLDGKIYIGVINNTVKGIKISRDHKDRLRQGVDAMMKEKIEPMVYLNQYDVIFHAIEGDLHVIGKHGKCGYVIAQYDSNHEKVPMDINDSHGSDTLHGTRTGKGTGKGMGTYRKQWLHVPVPVLV